MHNFFRYCLCFLTFFLVYFVTSFTHSIIPLSSNFHISILLLIFFCTLSCSLRLFVLLLFICSLFFAYSSELFFYNFRLSLSFRYFFILLYILYVYFLFSFSIFIFILYFHFYFYFFFRLSQFPLNRSVMLIPVCVKWHGLPTPYVRLLCTCLPSSYPLYFGLDWWVLFHSDDSRSLILQKKYIEIFLLFFCC